MKKLALIVCLMWTSLFSSAQCPPTDLYVIGQSNLNSFLADYPNCTDFPGSIILWYNYTDISPLQNLTSIAGNFEVLDPNFSSTPFPFAQLTNLESIGGNFVLQGFTDWVPLNGLSNLKTIGGELEFSLMNHTIDLAPLTALESVGGLRVKNTGFTTLFGFSVIDSISGFLVIQDNNNLVSIDELSSADVTDVYSLRIQDNPILSNCAVQSVCFLVDDPNQLTYIWDNAPNCNSRAEVEASCILLSNDVELEKENVFIFPNPVNHYFQIENLTEGLFQYSIMTVSGQLVQQGQTRNQDVINIEDLPSGMYLLNLQNGEDSFSLKLMKG